MTMQHPCFFCDHDIPRMEVWTWYERVAPTDEECGSYEEPRYACAVCFNAHPAERPAARHCIAPWSRRRRVMFNLHEGLIPCGPHIARAWCSLHQSVAWCDDKCELAPDSFTLPDITEQAARQLLGPVIAELKTLDPPSVSTPRRVQVKLPRPLQRRDVLYVERLLRVALKDEAFRSAKKRRDYLNLASTCPPWDVLMIQETAPYETLVDVPGLRR